MTIAGVKVIKVSATTMTMWDRAFGPSMQIMRFLKKQHSMEMTLPLSRANEEEKEEIETFRMPQPTWTRKRKRQVSAPADVKKVKAEKKEEKPDAKRRTPIYRDTSELYRLHRPGDEDYVLSHAIAGDLLSWRLKIIWKLKLFISHLRPIDRWRFLREFGRNRNEEFGRIPLCATLLL